MNNFLLIFNKLLLTVLLLIHLTHFSYAQSCSGNNHANNANGCDDSGNKYDYSFDGMPKPSNWRELDEYQYLLLEVGDDAASAPAPPQRRHERQVEEQEHEAHTFQEYGGGEHSSGESLDDFESWEKEMAEADNIREESFLESKVGRVVLASVAGIVFTIALLQLKSSAGDSDNNEKNIKNDMDKKEKKKKKDKKGTSTDEEDDNKKGLKKEKLDDDSSKSKMKSKKKKGKEKESTADKAKDDTDVQVKKKEVRDDDDGFVLVKKEEEEEEEKMSNKKKKKKKKKKKAPKID